MSNHFHLLVETPERTLSSGMKQLDERWAKYFNWRHDRVGHLFQSRYGGKPVECESHLRELCRYIVLNPVRAGIVEHERDYEWSSYRATAAFAPAPEWLEVDWTRSQFHEDPAIAIELFRQFVRDGASMRHQPWAADCILAAVCASFGETPERLRERGRGIARKASAQLAREGSRLTLREVGDVLRVNTTAAAKLAYAGQQLEQRNAFYRAALATARAKV
jgi:hypothetical protein